MKVLIAEDDPVSRRLLEATLTQMGHDAVCTENGRQALEILQTDDRPRLAILDWMMPVMDGVEVCRRVRQQSSVEGYLYVIFLTAKGQKTDIVAGLEAGADDYLTKPFDPDELRSRLEVGRRILQLESELATKVDELQQALSHVKQLQGLLPICMHCKNIRDDKDTWHRLESYIEQHTEAMFTHSLCDACLQKHYPKHMKAIEQKRSGGK